MHRRRILLTVLTAMGWLLGSAMAQANIERSCNGSYRIEIRSPGTNHLNVGQFEARRGCGDAVPDRCRRRAREAALACMRAHAGSGSSAHVNACFSNGVQRYHVAQLKEYLQGQVCDHLRWKDSPSHSAVSIDVYAATSGDTGCDAKEKLTSLTFSCPHASGGGNTPYSVNTTVAELKLVKNGQLVRRWVKTAVKQPAAPQVLDVSLYKTQADLTTGKPHGSSYDNTETKVDACGLMTAQAALRYFDIEMSQQQLENKVKNWSLQGADATAPSDLRKGLEAILHQHGFQVDVERTSGKTPGDILARLKAGLPVAALVDGGRHWILVTGARSGAFVGDTPGSMAFRVIDNGYAEIRTSAEMSLSFGGQATALMNLLKAQGSTSYLPGTFVYFEKRE